MRTLLILIGIVLLSGTESCVKERFYPRYHLAPPYGWMNDPNGLCVFKKYYHLFYQFNPNSSLVPGIAHWGHARSKDMFHWEHLPIALFPDQTYDHRGVFSGSALIEDNVMYLYYTGNTDIQEQALAISVDGNNLFKYARNTVLKGETHQPHFRDPKVWEHKGKYYMVLGNLLKNGTESFGRVLLYESEDKYNWKEVAVLQESDGSLGYMSECPDFFELDGKFVLLFSPQGIKPQGDLYNNLYQTGYIVGNFDYSSKKFKPVTSFVELDRGHDFYATQTMEDKGRRIVIGWFDMWDQNYPEGPDGFTGQMTIPRKLSLSKDNMLIQKPVSEISAIRGDTLCSGSNKNKTVPLPDKTAEILVTAKKSKSFEVIISANDASAEVTLRYDSESQYVSLNRGGSDGVRRAKWNPKGNVNWQIFVDASSIELFCGDGELTFSSRFFPEDNVVVKLVSTDPVQKFVVKALKRSVTDVTLC